MKLQKFARFSPVALALGLAAVAQNASAAIDVTTVTTLLSGDGATAVTAIGTAVLALLGIVMVFKFVRRAM